MVTRNARIMNIWILKVVELDCLLFDGRGLAVPIMKEAVILVTAPTEQGGEAVQHLLSRHLWRSVRREGVGGVSGV